MRIEHATIVPPANAMEVESTQTRLWEKTLRLVRARGMGFWSIGVGARSPEESQKWAGYTEEERAAIEPGSIEVFAYAENTEGS